VGVTPPSAWPWLDHSVSGLLPATERPVQTRFRSAYAYRLKLAANRNSLTHYTKGTMSRARQKRTASSDLVSTSTMSSCAGHGFPRNRRFSTLRLKQGQKKLLTFGEPAPSVCRHPVSGLFHSPCRGAFHLSLTVLVRYRSHTST
jgi:hypothetical protein